MAFDKPAPAAVAKDHTTFTGDQIMDLHVGHLTSRNVHRSAAPGERPAQTGIPKDQAGDEAAQRKAAEEKASLPPDQQAVVDKLQRAINSKNYDAAAKTEWTLMSPYTTPNTGERINGDRFLTPAGNKIISAAVDGYRDPRVAIDVDWNATMNPYSKHK